MGRFGIAVAGASDEVLGFPVSLFADGDGFVLDFPSPPLLNGLDPSRVGLAVLDPNGRCRAAWGLAERIRELRVPTGPDDGDPPDWTKQARRGRAGSVLVGDCRCHFARLSGPRPETLVLVTDATEERELRARSELDARTADLLRVMGRALASVGDVEGLCAAAVHELAACADLAAALIWTTDEDGKVLRLRAARGLAPSGRERLRRLPLNEVGTLAQRAGLERRTVTVPHVPSAVLTAGCEARFCLLGPGGAIALPLTGGDALYGVLEAVGRDRDVRFADCRFLFETVAEHLALAVRAADLLEATQRLATHDPLTGIANHRCLHDFLARRLAEAVRHASPLGVVMVDVDHFRVFNEEEGHAVGDAVLRLVARTLRESVRRSDLAARYGGEEFTLVLPGQDLDEVLLVAERVRRAVEALDLSGHTRLPRAVTVSLGCAGFPPTASEGAALLAAADEALYDAKRLGRNRSAVYDGPYRVREGRDHDETRRPRAA